MVKISLPDPNEFEGDVKHFLRQLELSVHHAQKAWERIETEAKENPTEWDEKWRDNFYVTFRFPKIDLYSRPQDEKGFAKVHVDEERDEMQDVELEINKI
jgi:hypothetical protein